MLQKLDSPLPIKHTLLLDSNQKLVVDHTSDSVRTQDSLSQANTRYERDSSPDFLNTNRYHGRRKRSFRPGTDVF